MNLLAHLHLGRTLPPVAAAGNFVADFIKTDSSGDFQTGVRFHRRIDSFTDNHPLVAQTRNLFGGRYRRFAGVLTDFAFDFCLSQSWTRWSPELSLVAFIDSQLDSILSAASSLPASAGELIRQMREERWLQNYSEINGIGDSIARIATRRKVAAGMLGGERVIAERAADLLAVFVEFYPQLESHCLAGFGNQDESRPAPIN